MRHCVTATRRNLYFHPQCDNPQRHAQVVDEAKEGFNLVLEGNYRPCEGPPRAGRGDGAWHVVPAQSLCDAGCPSLTLLLPTINR